MPTREEQDKACMALGHEVLTMMRDLLLAGPDPAYARRELKYPGGSMVLLLTNSNPVANAFEQGVAKAFAVASKTPHSQVN